MKNLMKVLSLVLFGVLIIVLATLLFDVGPEFTLFGLKTITVVVLNILPITSIALCCFCLERGDTNKFLKIIPIYMLISIFISIMLVFCYKSSLINLTIYNSLFGSTATALNNANFAEFLYKVYTFMSGTHLCLTLISLLFIVQTNNAVSALMKKLSYGTIIINILFSVFINIKTFTQTELPDVSKYEQFQSESILENYTSNDNDFLHKVYIISVVVESFTVISMFITNYAFSSSKEYVSNDVDIDSIKEQTIGFTTMQAAVINSPTPQRVQMFSTEPREIVKDASQTGIMNISNQLGNNSNVGQVKESAKGTNITINKNMNMDMPFSNGPVINQTLAPKPAATEPTPEPMTEAPTEIKTEVMYQDIGELMKQSQQINNNQNQM